MELCGTALGNKPPPPVAAVPLSPHTLMPGPTPTADIKLMAGPTHAIVLTSALAQAGLMGASLVFDDVFSDFLPERRLHL